jgi:hypothetical protein
MTTDKIIKDILAQSHHLRDDDRALIRAVWEIILARKGYNITDIDANGLLLLFIGKELPTPDYITRRRRYHQEKNPALRGKMWYKRHEIAEHLKKEYAK